MILSATCYALGYVAGLAAFGYMARRRGIATGGIWLLMSAGLSAASRARISRRSSSLDPRKTSVASSAVTSRLSCQTLPRHR